MEYTQNYALRKPGLNEYANVGDLNFNADKIDSQMKKNQDVDGEVYDPTTTSANAYEAGDYVINPDDGLMYVCNGTTYGTWDATKWDHTTEFEELQKAMASGGESELADLHDVDITNPTDGQALLYDPTSSKWHNSDLPDADVTKEASGNPIEFSDGADAPLVKCVTQITGYQEGSGTPSPDNIRPITAYTEGEIEVMGKNIGELSDNSKYEVYHATISYTDGGVITTSTGTYARSVFKYKVDIGKKYWVKFKGYGNGNYNRVNMGDSTSSSSSYGYKYLTSSSVTYTFEITTTTDELYVVFYVDGTSASSGSMTISDFQIVQSETEPTTYEPYVGTTHTTTYPSAIYRGSEDVVNDKETHTIPMLEFDGSVDENWIASTNPSYNTQFGIELSSLDVKLSGIWASNAICNMYVKQDAGVSDRNNNAFSIYYGGWGGVYEKIWLLVRDDRYTSVADFKTALSVNVLQIAVELATPTTSSVTPTNQPIKSLLGYNHIESSTGEMDIEYFPAKEQPLIDLIPEASNMHTYSTAEHAVGTWIDGSTVYEKTYTYSGNVPANPFETTIDFTGKQFLELIPHYAKYTYDGGSGYGEVVGSELLNNYSEMLQVQYYPEPYTLRVHSFLGNATESYDIAFTLRYTKTSSNSRSLAKSAPQEETKEEQTEEVKEEPEEPVEEVKEEVKEEETKEEGEVNER